MRKWIFASMLLSIGLTGCGRSPEEAKKLQTEQTPILICEKNGVQVWKVSDFYPGGSSHVYFTTPVGDVSWMVLGDEDTPPKHFQVPGVKKK